MRNETFKRGDLDNHDFDHHENFIRGDFDNHDFDHHEESIRGDLTIMHENRRTHVCITCMHACMHEWSTCFFNMHVCMHARMVNMFF